MTMSMASIFGTVNVVASPAAANTIGAVFAAPDKVTARVLIRNIGPSDVVIGLSPAAIAGIAIGANSNFRIPAGQDAVIVLAPRQTVYAVSVGATGRLSYAASAALPIDVVHV